MTAPLRASVSTKLAAYFKNQRPGFLFTAAQSYRLRFD